MKIKLNITYTKKELIFLKEHHCKILSEINLPPGISLINSFYTSAKHRFIALTYICVFHLMLIFLSVYLSILYVPFIFLYFLQFQYSQRFQSAKMLRSVFSAPG